MIGAFQRRLETGRQLGALLLARTRAHCLVARGATLGKKSACGARMSVLRPWGLRAGIHFTVEADVSIKLAGNAAHCHVGDFTFIGRGTTVDVLESVTIGSHTVIAPDCFITDHNHGITADRRIDQQQCPTAAVVIGDDVWLGTKAVVLAGVRIGSGAVIAAGSVVTRDVAPMTVVAGVPARFIRSRCQ